MRGLDQIRSCRRKCFYYHLSVENSSEGLFSPYPSWLPAILPFSPSHGSVPALTVRWKDSTAVEIAMVAGRLSNGFDLSTLRRHAFSPRTGPLGRRIDASGSDIAFLWFLEDRSGTRPLIRLK
ncbi:hypothetical protein SLE2022_396870 [Rubroshorea leprosula]